MTPPYTLFFVSPANLGGERARLLFDPNASFAIAEQLRTPLGAPLGDVFTFVSGLYFRGKRAYAEAFGRAPEGLSPALVISPCEGLRFSYERVTLERLRRWAEVPIDAGNRAFTEPLVEHVAALQRAFGDLARYVLLGSVATDKYVGPIAQVLGPRLCFPPAFVGRGDMSRGALLLRAARAAEELPYAPVLGSERQGRRAARLARTGTSADPASGSVARAGALASAEPTAVGAPSGAPTAMPELVILVGLPGAGKSTFYRQRFAATHTHVSLDLLRRSRRPARRQDELVQRALASGASVVVDNTNVGVNDRAALIAHARARGARVSVYFFEVSVSECVARNERREGASRIPLVGIYAAAKRLARPDPGEGFHAYFLVHPLSGCDFEVVKVM